jgi:hypothetical protein
LLNKSKRCLFWCRNGYLYDIGLYMGADGDLATGTRRRRISSDYTWSPLTDHDSLQNHTFVTSDWTLWSSLLPRSLNRVILIAPRIAPLEGLPWPGMSQWVLRFCRSTGEDSFLSRDRRGRGLSLPLETGANRLLRGKARYHSSHL